jgi:hypothetical protein
VIELKRAERNVDTTKILDEIEVYNGLLPDRGSWPRP